MTFVHCSKINLILHNDAFLKIQDKSVTAQQTVAAFL